MKKRCFKCSRALPMESFYRHKRMADGRLGKCIECTKADALQHRNSNIERVRAYDRARASENPARKAKLFARLSTLAARCPAARAAHVKTGNAIRDGRLKKAPCESCGAKTVVAHHDDYSMPLSVRWLCQPCHVRWHNANGPGKHRDLVPEKQSA